MAFPRWFTLYLAHWIIRKVNAILCNFSWPHFWLLAASTSTWSSRHQTVGDYGPMAETLRCTRSIGGNSVRRWRRHAGMVHSFADDLSTLQYLLTLTRVTLQSTGLGVGSITPHHHYSKRMITRRRAEADLASGWKVLSAMGLERLVAEFAELQA